jgi:hypothetical protein
VMMMRFQLRSRQQQPSHQQQSHHHHHHNQQQRAAASLALEAPGYAHLAVFGIAGEEAAEALRRELLARSPVKKPGGPANWSPVAARLAALFSLPQISAVAAELSGAPSRRASDVFAETSEGTPRLSSRGVEQVRSGQRLCSNKDVPVKGDPAMMPIRGDENAFLVRSLHLLSLWLAERTGTKMNLRPLANYRHMLFAIMVIFLSRVVLWLLIGSPSSSPSEE